MRMDRKLMGAALGAALALAGQLVAAGEQGGRFAALVRYALERRRPNTNASFE